MYSRRNYASPPLVEALCEIHFSSDQQWDWTIPGLLYAEIKGEFPNREQADHVSVRWREDRSEVQKMTLQRLRYFSEDRRSLVQVGANVVVLNYLSPYPGWEQFRASIGRVLERYIAVAAPRKVTVCALRYINHIAIPEEGAMIEDYLTTVPCTPGNLPETIVDWSLSLDIPHPEGEGIVHVESGSLVSGDPGFLLDIQFIATKPQELDLVNGLMRWIDTAHRIIEETFEASITSTARSIFQEVGHDQLSAR